MSAFTFLIFPCHMEGKRCHHQAGAAGYNGNPAKHRKCQQQTWREANTFQKAVAFRQKVTGSNLPLADHWHGVHFNSNWSACTLPILSHQIVCGHYPSSLQRGQASRCLWTLSHVTLQGLCSVLEGKQPATENRVEKEARGQFEVGDQEGGRGEKQLIQILWQEKRFTVLRRSTGIHRDINQAGEMWRELGLQRCRKL